MQFSRSENPFLSAAASTVNLISLRFTPSSSPSLRESRYKLWFEHFESPKNAEPQSFLALEEARKFSCVGFRLVPLTSSFFSLNTIIKTNQLRSQPLYASVLSPSVRPWIQFVPTLLQSSLIGPAFPAIKKTYTLSSCVCVLSVVYVFATSPHFIVSRCPDGQQSSLLEHVSTESSS